MALGFRERELTRGGMILSPSWLSALALALGGGVLLGGDRRFSGPSFAAHRVIAPWWVWGLVFVVYGVVLIATSWFSRKHAEVVAFGAPLYGFLATTFAFSIYASPAAGATSLVVWGWIAATHARLSVAIKALPNQGVLWHA